MANKKLDIRMIQLARWQIPKTKSVFDFNNENTYLSIGYFDMIDASDVMEQNLHPLLAAYGASQRHPDISRENDWDGTEEKNTSLLRDYTVQELLLFTNIREEQKSGFEEEKIKAFWKETSPLMFISLIHIDNESRIDVIISKIQKCFQGKEYLYYFSFDYSGIVLLAKNMNLKSYLQLMFQLNYESENGNKVIRDSYSFYGFHKKELKRIFDALDQGECIKDAFSKSCLKEREETFTVSVNIGIQNFNIYENFINTVKNYSPDVKEYGLFGRHDISIVKEDANLEWLVYIQYLLDQVTKDEEVAAEYLFSTHETFIKVSNIGEYADIAPKKDTSNSAYQMAQERLDTKCSDYFEMLKRKKEQYNGEYGIPIEAVKNSILSIMKNRFAEDFVLCMYQSFYEFLEYLLEKMGHEDDDIRKFDDCFSEYFRGLNSLVNSAMHSERQFIQATAFNAIIYDVPSKIMAFYVALIDEFQGIMRGETDQCYTFLLTPSFSNEISVKIISYSEERPPHDRILMVSINERSLYNPKAVIRRMAHEVAHFVGDELRERASRKKRVKLSILYIILSQVLHGSYLSSWDLYGLIEKIEKVLSTDTRFADNEYNYSEDLLKVLPEIAEELTLNHRIKNLLYNYIMGILKNYLMGRASEREEYKEEREEIWRYALELSGPDVGTPTGSLQDAYEKRNFSETQLQLLTNLIYRDMKEELGIVNKDKEVLKQKGRVSQSLISRVGSKILNEKTVGEYVKTLSNIYSEAFADVQMVLLTGLTYEDYLEGFINEEKIDISRWEFQMEDNCRISMVTFALRITGVWEQPDTEKKVSERVQKEQSDELVEFQKKIEEQIVVLKRSISETGKCEVNECFGAAADISDSEKHKSDQNTIVWSADDEAPNNNILYYINEHLLIYLLECIKKSADCYRSKSMEEIGRLRKLIRTVSDFEDVQIVFSDICNEIRGYKDRIFPDKLHQDF